MNYELLIFNEKPRLKIGDKVKEITAENGRFVFYYDVIVKKIQKKNKQYQVFLERTS